MFLKIENNHQRGLGCRVDRVGMLVELGGRTIRSKKKKDKDKGMFWSSAKISTLWTTMIHDLDQDPSAANQHSLWEIPSDGVASKRLQLDWIEGAVVLGCVKGLKVVDITLGIMMVGTLVVKSVVAIIWDHASINTDIVSMLSNHEVNEHGHSESQITRNDSQVILGVDRLDYTKGLVNRFHPRQCFWKMIKGREMLDRMTNRFRAFERLLSDFPEFLERVMLLQVIDLLEFVEDLY